MERTTTVNNKETRDPLSDDCRMKIIKNKEEIKSYLPLLDRFIKYCKERGETQQVQHLETIRLKITDPRSKLTLNSLETYLKALKRQAEKMEKGENGKKERILPNQSAANNKPTVSECLTISDDDDDDCVLVSVEDDKDDFTVQENCVATLSTLRKNESQKEISVKVNGDTLPSIMRKEVALKENSVQNNSFNTPLCTLTAQKETLPHTSNLKETSTTLDTLPSVMRKEFALKENTAQNNSSNTPLCTQTAQKETLPHASNPIESSTTLDTLPSILRKEVAQKENTAQNTSSNTPLCTPIAQKETLPHASNLKESSTTLDTLPSILRKEVAQKENTAQNTSSNTPLCTPIAQKETLTHASNPIESSTTLPIQVLPHPRDPRTQCLMNAQTQPIQMPHNPGDPITQCNMHPYVLGRICQMAQPTVYVIHQPPAPYFYPPWFYQNPATPYVPQRQYPTFETDGNDPLNRVGNNNMRHVSIKQPSSVSTCDIKKKTSPSPNDGPSQSKSDKFKNERKRLGDKTEDSKYSKSMKKCHEINNDIGRKNIINYANSVKIRRSRHLKIIRAKTLKDLINRKRQEPIQNPKTKIIKKKSITLDLNIDSKSATIGTSSGPLGIEDECPTQHDSFEPTNNNQHEQLFESHFCVGRLKVVVQQNQLLKFCCSIDYNTTANVICGFESTELDKFSQHVNLEHYNTYWDGFCAACFCKVTPNSESLHYSNFNTQNNALSHLVEVHLVIPENLHFENGRKETVESDGSHQTDADMVDATKSDHYMDMSQPGVISFEPDESRFFQQALPQPYSKLLDTKTRERKRTSPPPLAVPIDHLPPEMSTTAKMQMLALPMPSPPFLVRAPPSLTNDPNFFKCGNKGCTFETSHASELLRHLVLCVPERPSKRMFCPYCQNNYKLKDSFVNHLLTHGPKRYTCGVCKYSTTDEPDVREHMKTNHQVDDPSINPVKDPDMLSFAVTTKENKSKTEVKKKRGGPRKT